MEDPLIDGPSSLLAGFYPFFFARVLTPRQGICQDVLGSQNSLRYPFVHIPWGSYSLSDR